MKSKNLFDFNGIVTALVFFASALLPIGIYYLFIEKNSTIESDTDSIFPSSVKISSKGTFIKVSHHARLNPTDNQDFLLVSWFKFQELPSAKQDMTLLFKADLSKRLPIGYMLRLVVVGKEIRPVVSWYESSGKGEKSEFASVQLNPLNWYGFFMLYKYPNILALHLVELTEEDKPRRKFLGAHRLKQIVLPNSDADLIIGATRFGTFRGLIGPVAVLNSIALGEKFNQIIKKISKEPREVSNNFTQSELVFFTENATTDLGPLKLPIVTKENLVSNNQEDLSDN